MDGVNSRMTAKVKATEEDNNADMDCQGFQWGKLPKVSPSFLGIGRNDTWVPHS